MKKMGKKGIKKRLFSVILSAAVLVACMPGSGLLVYAEGQCSRCVTCNHEMRFHSAEYGCQTCDNITNQGCAGEGHPGTQCALDDDHLGAHSSTRPHDHGNFAEEWSTNATGHWHACGNADCDVTEDNVISHTEDGFAYATHSGGTATCQAKAKCSTCQAEYGEKTNHDYEYSATNNVLTANCKTSGCTESHTLTLTVSNANYSGSPAEITIGKEEEKTAWKDAGLIVPTAISYETAEGVALETAPTEAGNYVAKVSPVGETATDANTAKVSFTILQSVTGVTLNKQTTSIKVGSEETLTATVAPTDAANKNVTWSSGDTSIATVDTNGKVTAVSAGTVDITAKTENGGFTATCTVTVESLEFAEVKDKIMGAYQYGGSVWNVSETGISLSWLNNFDLVIYQARNLEISENENSIVIKLKAIIFDWELKFNIESGKAVSLVEDRSSVYKLAGDYNYDGNTLTITGDGTLSGIMVETALYSHPEITKVVVSGYEEIGYAAFYKCPNTVKSVNIGDSVKNIVNYAFYKCESLESVDLGNGVETIGIEAFEYTGLKEVTIPDSVKTIDEGAFQWTGLKEVTIPDSVKTVNQYAFYGCEELESVVIGKGVKEIGEAAFGYVWNSVKEKEVPAESFTVKGHGTGEGSAAYTYFSTYKGANWKYINLDAKPVETDSEFGVSGLVTTLSFVTKEAEDSVLHIDGIELADVYQTVAASNVYEGIYVTCDGEEVVKQGNYEVKEGSVKVIFTDTFLNSLSVGSHTIKTYLNGTEAADTETYDYVFETKITVTPKPSTGGGSSTTPTTTPTYKVPNTSVGYDNNPMNKTIGLLSIALVAGCIVKKKKED